MTVEVLRQMEVVMFARIMAAVTLLGVVGMFSAFMLGIWSGDERWLMTGMVGVFLTIIVGGIAGAALDNGEFR